LEETLYRAFHKCFPTNFGSFGYSVSERFVKIDQPEKELSMVAMFVTGSRLNYYFL
jgi:hypothetical protein